MYPAKFEYTAATTLEEAISLLEDPDAKIVAGGHSLLPLMKLRLAQPGLLVDIGRIPGLSYVRSENGVLCVGALTTYRELQLSEETKQRHPLLVEAIEEVGDPQVRARGTLAGGLAHADPAADLTAVMLALGAVIRVVGPDGQRDIGVDDFFVDMLTTSLGEREIITEVRVPMIAAGSGSVYIKFEQPASHYALTGVCALVPLGADGRLGDVRIGVTGVGPKAYRPTAVEQALRGLAVDEDTIREAVQSVADGIDVLGDIHASTEYRAHLARVLTRRAVLQAAERARGGA